MSDDIVAEPDGCIGSTETHISRLWLSPDRVYKMLKPVEFEFLDLSDQSDRLAAADREVELNRRFAPDVYLGSADIVEEGETVERMIVMRRLPADRRLSAITLDPDFDDCLRSVARQVAGFHSSAEPVLDAPMATRDRVEANWTANFRTLEAHVGTILDRDEYDRVRHLATHYLAGRAELFDARIAQGFVVDGHGDLIADDIYCLADGPRLLDCLAFDDELRIADVLADIGFLVMDVHRLAGRRAAVLLMDAYHQFSNEQHPSSLAHHYVAYRAHVRAKIACLRVAQGDTTQVELARTYHHLALHHLERSQVRMVLVGGGPGVGKTTVATALAEHTGYIRLSSDEIRRDVTGTAPGEHHFVEPGTGIYTPGAVADNYRELGREAGILLAAGNGVVLDASWSLEEHRRAVRTIAERHGADLVEIECSLDPATARERITHRMSDPWDSSDATPDVVDHIARRHEPWPEAATISTAATIDQVTADAVSVLDRFALPGRVLQPPNSGVSTTSVLTHDASP